MMRRLHIAAKRCGAAGVSLVAALAVMSCTQAPLTPPPSIKPQPKPAPEIVASKPIPSSIEDTHPEPSPVSRALSSYYAKVQTDLLRNELLRIDGGGGDTPFSAFQLADNFDVIALNDEYTSVNGTFVATQTPSNLHRWSEPVRLALEFGDSVPDAQREADRAVVSALTQQLARATQHPITFSGSSKVASNFHVLVLNEDERRMIGPRLEQLIPGIGDAAIASVQNMPRTSYCLVIASDPNDDGEYRQAVAIIRGEHPSLLRQSCFHEEIAQGLGLANDSPRARPSIFNDDEEFALLTRHDELLLRMLYDTRLKPGMSPEVARHISAQIARELLGDSI